VRLAVVALVPLAATAACAVVRVPPPPSAPPVTPGHRFVQRAALAADIDSMLAMIERVHPDPYTVVSRDSMRRARDATVSALPDSTTRMDIWPAYARLVALIGDGHTNVLPPGEEILGFVALGGLVMPTRSAATDSGSVTVTTYRSGDALLHRGDELVAVNERSVDSLLGVFAAEIGGESPRWRRSSAARQFESLLLVNGVRAPYTVDVRVAGSATPRRLTVPGAGRDSLVAADRRARASAPTVTSSGFTYRPLSSGVAYMNVFTLGGDLGVFRKELDSVFQRVRADSVRTLIIDLRSNGGGDSRLGDELLSHFATHAYRMDSMKRWKMSREYRTYVKSMVRPPLNHLPLQKVIPTGRRMFSGPDGSIVPFETDVTPPPKRDPRFDGAVCVLIGDGTFSSAVDLADAIKTYKLATLIGEETGGRPNTFGEVYYFRTQATGFLVGASSAAFVRANGDTTDHRGVLPDIEVHRSADDVRAGRDPVVDRARSCPRVP
jgi:peptidase S41-like protein